LQPDDFPIAESPPDPSQRHHYTPPANDASVCCLERLGDCSAANGGLANRYPLAAWQNGSGWGFEQKTKAMDQPHSAGAFLELIGRAATGTWARFTKRVSLPWALNLSSRQCTALVD